MKEAPYFRRLPPLRRLLWLHQVAGGTASILKTVTGALLHITDALAKPLVKCEVTLEPIQDLHGQANPYPAGGGKNKFDPDANPNKWIGSDGTLSSVTGAKTSQKIYTNGAELTFVVSTGDSETSILCIAGYGSDDSLITRTAQNGVRYLTFTTTPSMNYILASTYLNHPIQLESGSTATAYAPYSNECPITGHTGVTVYHSDADTDNPTTYSITFPALGKNLLNPSEVTTAGVGTYGLTFSWDSSSGAFNCSGTYNSSTVSNPSFRILNVPSEVRTLNVKGFSSSANFNIIRWQSDADQIVLSLNDMVNGNNYDITVYPMIYEGSTAPSSYEPYTSTVYSGTMDLVSGKLVVDMAKITKNSTSGWVRGSAQGYYFDQNDLPTPDGVVHTDVLCNKLKSSTIGDNIVRRDATYKTINIRTANSYATVAEMVTDLGELEFVYPLATPIEIDLTPQQITALLGENNIWSDSNGDIEVTYKASAS